MTEQHLTAVLNDTPQVRAVFRLKKVRPWVQDLGIKAGDEIVRIQYGYRTMGKDWTNLAEGRPHGEIDGIRASEIDFIGYRDVRL